MVSMFASEEKNLWQAEDAALRNAVADITFAWAHIESSMVALLGEILNHPVKNKYFASAIYFAPSNLETRFSIVDKALKEMFYGTMIEKDVIELWEKLLKKLSKLKKTRNKVAHGHITSIHLHDKNKHYLRLTAPLFNVQEVTRKLDNPPGLSANDIQICVLATRREGNKISKIQNLVMEFWKNNIPEQHKIIAEMKSEASSNPLS